MKKRQLQFARMRAFGLPLLLLALTGCLHRSPDLAILAPFGEDDTELFDDSLFPAGYVMFEDSVTASVFRSLVQSGRLKVAPKGSILYCRGVEPDGVHGYAVGARVVSVKGDTAFAALSRSCRRMPRTPEGTLTIGAYIEYTTQYLMVRKRGKWRVEKTISGEIAVPM